MTATLTPAEVAAYLRVSPSFVYKKWRELGGAKFGTSQTSRLRFRPEAIEAYIRAHETPAPGRTRPHVLDDHGADVRHLRRFAARRVTR